MYLISILVFSLLKNNNYKQVIKDLIIGGITLIFGYFVQMMLIKCSEVIFGVKQTRANDLKNLLSNINITISNLYDIVINTGFVYIKYLYLAFIIILEAFIIIKAYKEKLTDKFLIDSFLIVSFSIIFGLAISFISTSGFWSARIRYSIGATIGLLLIYLYSKTDLLEDIKKTTNFLLLFTFSLYALTIVINYIGIMNNTLNVNYKDKEIAIEIINYVEEYEQKNDVVVNNLAVFYGPFESKAYYKEMKYKNSVLSWSSMRTQWSIEGTLEMYSNREFNLVDSIEDDIIYYTDNVNIDKDYMCINDTLYISYYIK